MDTAEITARDRRTASRAEETPAALATPWRQRTFGLALAGQVLLWAAMPPLQWSLLAWLAPVPWLLLVQRETLWGKRPYLAIWFSSFLFHLAALYWVTLPHWATSIGWVALAFYLGLYFAAFVAIARVAAHRLKCSVVLAAPVVWVGLEFARAHVLTGFGMATLAHTQYRWPLVLQTSDLAGSYAVSFLIVLAAACAARMLGAESARRVWWPAATTIAVVSAALGYGAWRLQQDDTAPGPKVALIQGSIDIEMKYDPDEARTIFEQYYGLSRRAVDAHADLDLIVWPETMFRESWLTFAPDFKPPADAEWTVDQALAASRKNIERVAGSLGVPMLLGVDTVLYKTEGFEHFNTALLADRAGNVIGRYDKCHLVPFGEYVFLADRFPWLYRLTPLPSGATPGDGPLSMQLDNVHGASSVRYAPSICYENTLPHFIRGQVSELRARGEEPDVLVNLTNDGWFWGSTELDMHLACAVLRSIESRKPSLIAANTGFSAWIDSDGRILAQGRRRETDVIVAEPRLDRRTSPYLLLGDWPAAFCMLAAAAIGVVGLTGVWQRRRAATKEPQNTQITQTKTS